MKLITVSPLLAKLAASHDLFPKDPRIVGGIEVEESRYPYMVALKENIFGNLTCGGSLIAKDTVLTAAHCVYGYEEIYYLLVKAVIGRDDLNSLSGEELSVDYVLVHPNYDNTTYVNDIALIFLSEPSSLVTEFPLLNNDVSVPAPGDLAHTMGWGDTTQDIETQVLSDVLLETDLSIMSNEDCIEMIESFYDSIGLGDFLALLFGIQILDFDSKTMICALEPGQDACQGDSGGPLILKGSSTGQDVLIGVVSWGHGCGEASQPGVFSRVSDAFDWISTSICSGSIAPPDYLCIGTPETPEPSVKMTTEPTEQPTISPMMTTTLEPSLNLIQNPRTSEPSVQWEEFQESSHGPTLAMNELELRYPYVVALETKFSGNFTCAGTLIAQDIVLTSAQCVYGYEDIYHLVVNAVIGRIDLDSLSGEEVSVDSVVVHPDYDNITLVYDFALIFLSQPTSEVTEFALLNNDESVPAPDDLARTVGWKNSSPDVVPQISSEILLESELPIMSNEDCFTTIDSHYDSIGLDDFVASLFAFDSKSMICTLGQDPCPGNLGSPLVLKGSSTEQDVLIGVVSWALDCDDSSLPQVFSRVSEAFDWITTTTCSGSIAPPQYLCNLGLETSEPSTRSITKPTQQPTLAPMETSTLEPTFKLTENPTTAVTIESTTDLEENQESSLDPTLTPTNDPELRYPYMVALEIKLLGNLTCAGSLIAQDTVLTAAHCIYGFEDIYPYLVRAVIGRDDLGSPSGEEVSLDHVVLHPDYDNITYVNDFALIFLSKSVKEVADFALVNNDESVPAVGDLARTMRWGDIAENAEPDILAETNLPITSNEDCFTTVDSYYDSIGLDDSLVTMLGISLVSFDSESMMCTLDPTQSPCPGYSGGPLILPGSSADKDVLVGIVSWGFGCDDSSLPQVYSRVSEAFDWISTTVCFGSTAPPEYLCSTTPLNVYEESSQNTNEYGAGVTIAIEDLVEEESTNSVAFPTSSPHWTPTKAESRASNEASSYTGWTVDQFPTIITSALMLLMGLTGIIG